jgi:[ribosomal protein S5]-alanine N-acetyltransferase
MRTERLEIRPVVESDRRRFVELFMDRDFMVFSATGVLGGGAANARFDHMMAFSRKVPFGKQAIVESSTASVVGYVGVDEFEFLGEIRFEFGYRLDKVVHGIGYATEASRALLGLIEKKWKGELLAFIDPENSASRNVLLKTGFALVDRIMIRGGACDLYCRRT